MSNTAPTSPEHIELACEHCEETFVGGSPGQPRSAAFQLASHRYRIHGIRKDGTVREKKASTKETRERIASEIEDPESRPVLATVRDIADDMGKGKGPPNERQLVAALGRTVGLASTAVASYIAETDDGLSDEQKDEVTAYLSVSDKAANDMVRPIAKALSGTTLNKRYGRGAVENVDVVGSFFELGEVVLHYRRYLRDRRMRRLPEPIEALSWPSSEAPPVIIGDTFDGAPVAPGGTGVPGEVVLASGGGTTKGVLWTPEMVKGVKRA
jgi:hypothetical protein